MVYLPSLLFIDNSPADLNCQTADCFHSFAFSGPKCLNFFQALFLIFKNHNFILVLGETPWLLLSCYTVCVSLDRLVYKVNILSLKKYPKV